MATISMSLKKAKQSGPTPGWLDATWYGQDPLSRLVPARPTSSANLSAPAGYRPFGSLPFALSRYSGDLLTKSNTRQARDLYPCTWRHQAILHARPQT